MTLGSSSGNRIHMWQFNGQKRPEFAEATEDGQESVWDYPRPPICVPDLREVTVHLGDVQVASSHESVRVLETASPPTFYLPLTDVNLDLLRKSSNNSFCEWKGLATYWSIHADGQVLENAAWSYEDLPNEYALLESCISFYPALFECRVDGELVKPQPGKFYGGWVTSEVVGPFKGEDGTWDW